MTVTMTMHMAALLLFGVLFLSYLVIMLTVALVKLVNSVCKDVEELRTRVDKLERVKSIDASKRALSIHGDK